jgi:hypothetical protein
MSDEAAYQTRYCAFVDIVGFTSLISDLGRGVLTPDTVGDLLRSVHKQPTHWE